MRSIRGYKVGLGVTESKGRMLGDGGVVCVVLSFREELSFVDYIFTFVFFWEIYRYFFR